MYNLNLTKMKKLVFAFAALVAVSLASCGGSTTTETVEEEVAVEETVAVEEEVVAVEEEANVAEEEVVETEEVVEAEAAE